MAGKTTILTLCNYDVYNPISQGDVQGEGQGGGKVTAGSIRSNKEDKEDKEEKKENFLFEKNEEQKGWKEHYDDFLNKEPEPVDLSFMRDDITPEEFKK